MVGFGLFESILVALIGGAAGGAFTPWFSARMEKAEKRQNLFEPIYNNISHIADNGLTRASAKKWDSMQASDQLLVSSDIEKDLSKYSEKCSDYTTSYGQLFYKRGKFDSILSDDLYSVHGEHDTPEIRVPSSESEIRVANILLPNLIHRLKLYSCESPDKLRRRVVQDAERRDETPYLNSVQYLNSNHPEWTSVIHEILQSETGQQWIAQKEEVEECAKDIKPKLRKCVLSRTDRLKRRFSWIP